MKCKKILSVVSLILCFSLSVASVAFAQEQATSFENVNIFINTVDAVLDVTDSVFLKSRADAKNDSSNVRFIFVFFREEPGLFSEIKQVLWYGHKLKIIGYSGIYAYVENVSTKDKGYVFKPFIEDDEGELSLNRSYEHVYVGATNADKNTGLPRTKAEYDSGGEIRYSTDNTDIIYVDSKTGLITGKKPGKANLIATAGGKSVSCPVHCIYKWKKGWTSKALTATKVRTGPGTGYTEITTLAKGGRFVVGGDEGGSDGWAYGNIQGTNTWGFVKIGDISTKGTVSQYNNMTTTLGWQKVPWKWPVLNEIDGETKNGNANYISSPYAPRSDSTSTTIHHRGMDITTGKAGEIKKYSVVSAVSGTVKAVRLNIDSCGYCVSISSDCTDPVTGEKIAIIYMHLYGVPAYSDGKPLSPGDPISAGTIIGKVGNTNNNTSVNMGYHLHFETNNKNAAVGNSGRSDFTNTINPIYYYMDKTVRINDDSEACKNGHGVYWYNKNK